MNIQRTIRPNQAPKSNSKPVKADTPKSESPEPKSIDVNDVIVKGAFASGGAITGVGLGVLTGQVLSNLAGGTSFGTIGGLAGAVTGAGTALAMADSDDKWNVLKDVTLGWGGGTLGAGAGQFILGELINQAGTAAAMPVLAASGPLLGTAVGGLMGGAAPIYGATEGKPKMLRDAAITTGGATAGLLIGTGARAWAMTGPAFEGLGMAAPAVAGLAGGAIAYAIADKEQNFEHAYEVATSAGMGTLGYGVGTLLGGISGAGGSQLYRTLPVVLGALGTTAGYAMSWDPDDTEANTLNKTRAGTVAGTGSAAVFAAMGGDLLGSIMTEATGFGVYRPLLPAMAAVGAGVAAYGSSLNNDEKRQKLEASAASLGMSAFGMVGGQMAGGFLTHITGNGAYTTLAPVVGAVPGLMMGASEFTENHREQLIKGAASVGITSSILGVGAALGEGLTRLTGNPFYTAVGAGVGAINGALVTAEGNYGVDTKGAMEAGLGAVGGTAAGIALGEGLSLLTGQPLWKASLPVLGAVAGGLGGKAFDILKPGKPNSGDQQ